MRTKTEHTAPLVRVGWILGADERDPERLQLYEQSRVALGDYLQQQFPMFAWELPYIERRRFTSGGGLQPLALLEIAVQEKIDRVWDYALILVPNELEGTRNSFTAGVPSSALEAAALSSARIGPGPAQANDLAALAVHMLGHMWGLEHTDEGPMCLDAHDGGQALAPFPAQQREAARERLEEVADARLEEESVHWGWWAFHWNTFRADARGIVTDVMGYAPWRMPLRMGRLTAAAAVTMIFLLLGAESWEIGTHLPPLGLGLGALGSVFAATGAVYFGQNLSRVGRGQPLREQLTRTRMVLYFTLLIGMASLWLVLLVVSALAVFTVPDTVTANWLNGRPVAGDLLRHAAFVATLGIVAAALGGNLEEQDEFKSKLYFDEEV